MNRLTRTLLAAGLVLTAGTAVAHTGHDSHSGFTSGLLHPLLGLDHLLAMIAIGIWSLRQSPALRRGTPLLVVAGMILGAAMARSGLALPGVETGIALSVLLAGILLAALARLPTAAGGALVAAFMLVHGHAHGTEMPAGATLATYLAGFSLVTLAITFAGQAAGAALLQADSRITRAIGGVVAGAGVLLAA